jgi:hypothetical protein
MNTKGRERINGVDVVGGFNSLASSFESIAENIENELKAKHEPFGGSTYVILKFVRDEAAMARKAAKQLEGK